MKTAKFLLQKNSCILNCFMLYFLVSGIAVIVLSVLNMHQEAAWISYPMMLMLVIYWVAYWVMQKRI